MFFFNLEFFLQGGQQCWALWAFLAACPCTLFIDIICLCLLIGQIKMLVCLLAGTDPQLCAVGLPTPGGSVNTPTVHSLPGGSTSDMSL